MKLTPWEPDIRTLMDRIELGDIDLQPDFQRQEVWSVSKKRRLIDTVLRGWSIPPVHLVTTADNKLEVLDGQQRLVSLRDFVSGKFSVDGRITPLDDRVKLLHGKFYKTLEPSIRRNIDQYSLRCFRISDYEPEEPSELFYRLNQPTMLTAGEQRNALYGPARVQLKELVYKFENLGNNRSSIGFSNARLAYDDIIARLLFFVEIGSFGVKGSEDRISERFRARSGFPADVVERADNAVELFSLAREAAPYTRFNKATLLSWLLFYLRFDGDRSQLNYLGFFVESRDSINTNDRIPSAMALFDDRSSLRVTDVSSVVYRDFVLWYVYYIVMGRIVPDSVRADIIEAADKRYLLNRENFEDSISAVVDVEAWSGIQ